MANICRVHGAGAPSAFMLDERCRYATLERQPGVNELSRVGELSEQESAVSAREAAMFVRELPLSMPQQLPAWREIRHDGGTGEAMADMSVAQ